MDEIHPATDAEIAQWRATAENYTGCTTERLIVRLDLEQARAEAAERTLREASALLNGYVPKGETFPQAIGRLIERAEQAERNAAECRLDAEDAVIRAQEMAEEVAAERDQAVQKAEAAERERQIFGARNHKLASEVVDLEAERDALAAQVAYLQQRGDALHNAASRARAEGSWSYGAEVQWWADAAVKADKGAAVYQAALRVAEALLEERPSRITLLHAPKTTIAITDYCAAVERAKEGDK